MPNKWNLMCRSKWYWVSFWLNRLGIATWQQLDLCTRTQTMQTQWSAMPARCWIMQKGWVLWREDVLCMQSLIQHSMFQLDKKWPGVGLCKQVWNDSWLRMKFLDQPSCWFLILDWSGKYELIKDDPGRQVMIESTVLRRLVTCFLCGPCTHNIHVCTLHVPAWIHVVNWGQCQDTWCWMQKLIMVCSQAKLIPADVIQSLIGPCCLMTNMSLWQPSFQVPLAHDKTQHVNIRIGEQSRLQHRNGAMSLIASLKMSRDVYV